MKVLQLLVRRRSVVQDTFPVHPGVALPVPCPQTGDFEEAARYLEQATTLRPPDSGLLNTLGDAYDRLGDDKLARQNFERSLELDPNQPEIQKRLEPASRS